jgi:hypothetical protein
LVLPIIFLYLKNEDVPKVFEEALSWGRSKVVKFMKIYYDLPINLGNIVDSHLLKELTLIGVY